MAYGTDPKFFTQGLEQPFQEVLLGIMRGIGARSNQFLESMNRVVLATALWESEGDSRLFCDEPEITQFEYAALTSGLMAYADHVGVYSPHIWEFFCDVTDNPDDANHEQRPCAAPQEAFRTFLLAKGETSRICFATSAESGTNGVIAADEIVPPRYSPPSCESCSSTDTHVGASLPKFRRLHCRTCGHWWKLRR
jgi:hypothetical protein